MNTESPPRVHPQDEPERNSTEKRRFLDLSATQLISGALATATAATLGSKLGLAGTISGAVLASLLTALASAIYGASLQRGRDRVRAVVSSTRARPKTAARLSPGNQPPARTQPYTQAPASPIVRTDVSPHVSPRRTTEPAGPGRRLAGLQVRAMLVGAVAVFVTAIAGITGFELLSGHALSGGSPTTVQQLGGDGGQSTSRPATTPSTTTPSPSPSVTVTVTTTAAAPTSATPTPSPTTSPTATDAPTPSSSPTDPVSSTPSPTPSPSGTRSDSTTTGSTQSTP